MRSLTVTIFLFLFISCSSSTEVYEYEIYSDDKVDLVDSKLLFNNNKSQNGLNDTTYGKNFSQERYLMKKKKNNFLCQNQKFIC